VTQTRQVDIYDYTGQAHFVKPLPKISSPCMAATNREHKNMLVRTDLFTAQTTHQDTYCTPCVILQND